MRVRVQKWGNSLARRIPRSYAAATSLNPGAEVDLTLEDGRLVATPVTATRYRLEDLLAEVTPENIHGEVDAGPNRAADCTDGPVPAYASQGSSGLPKCP
jgi:antitoxin MazE